MAEECSETPERKVKKEKPLEAGRVVGGGGGGG